MWGLRRLPVHLLLEHRHLHEPGPAFAVEPSDATPAIQLVSLSVCHAASRSVIQSVSQFQLVSWLVGWLLTHLRALGLGVWGSTRWSTTLSSKVNVPHVINVRTLCGANLIKNRNERNPRTPPGGRGSSSSLLLSSLELSDTKVYEVVVGVRIGRICDQQGSPDLGAVQGLGVTVESLGFRVQG